MWTPTRVIDKKAALRLCAEQLYKAKTPEQVPYSAIFTIRSNATQRRKTVINYLPFADLDIRSTVVELVLLYLFSNLSQRGHRHCLHLVQRQVVAGERKLHTVVEPNHLTGFGTADVHGRNAVHIYQLGVC